MPVLYANLAVIVVGAFCLWKVHQDLNGPGKRSLSAALLVWVIYIAHTALTIWASWASVWPLDLDRDFSRAAGVGLLVAGVCILLSGMLEFRSLARISGRRPDRLVRTGMYRWTRNPQNVGWGLALLGVAIHGQSAAALMLAVEFWVAFRLYVPWEERFLKRVYGEDWKLYRETTPRFFGLPKDFIYQPPITLKIVQREVNEASTSHPV